MKQKEINKVEIRNLQKEDYDVYRHTLFSDTTFVIRENS